MNQSLIKAQKLMCHNQKKLNHNRKKNQSNKHINLIIKNHMSKNHNNIVPLHPKNKEILLFLYNKLLLLKQTHPTSEIKVE